MSCCSAESNRHARTDRQRVVCLHAHPFTAACIPLTHPEAQLPQGVTVHSGGSETSGHVRMQIIKRREFGSAVKNIWRSFRNHTWRQDFVFTARQKTSSLGGAEVGRASGKRDGLRFRSLKIIINFIYKRHLIQKDAIKCASRRQKHDTETLKTCRTHKENWKRDLKMNTIINN